MSDAALAPRARPTRAAFEFVAGVAVLSAMDAFVKLVAARYPVVEVTFLRFLFGAAGACVAVAAARPRRPSPETIFVNGVRGLLVVATALAFFYALGTLPLAEALALSFLAPVFMALFGALFLREALDRRIGAALALGLLGMAVIVGGTAGSGAYTRENLLGAAAAIFAAVTYALAMVLLRARATKDGVVVIVALQNLIPALVLAGPAAVVWVPPAPGDWAIFALIGTLGVGGHLLLARALAKAEAARVAPLEYTALVWAVAFGYAFFDEIPTLATLSGAALIVIGAVIASRR